MRPSLFQLKDFTSHAGLPLTWKIECDSLMIEDYAALARIVRERWSYREALGIPCGGLRFAAALNQLSDMQGDTLIIADDVYTTGKSMEDFRASLDTTRPVIGVVIFARGKVTQDWVFPIFQLWAK